MCSRLQHVLHNRPCHPYVTLLTHIRWSYFYYLYDSSGRISSYIYEEGFIYIYIYDMSYNVRCSGILGLKNTHFLIYIQESIQQYGPKNSHFLIKARKLTPFSAYIGPKQGYYTLFIYTGPIKITPSSYIQGLFNSL
jgi:hypothetical protein